jgi:hypothetical protein
MSQFVVGEGGGGDADEDALIKEAMSRIPKAPEFLDGGRHVSYFFHCLQVLPSAYSSLDTNRLTL